MLHVISTLVLFMIAVGIYLRRRLHIHWAMMTGAFLIDLGLVLYIELSRHALNTVVVGFKPMIWFHATISTMVLALYLVQIVIGWRLLQGRLVSVRTGVRTIGSFDSFATRNLHRNLGITFCLLRVINYVAAFML